VLTCTGALSRNRHVGIELGKGRPLTEILAGMRMVAEGVGTASALLALAGEAGIELPITEQVDAILSHGKSPRQQSATLWSVPFGANDAQKPRICSIFARPSSTFVPVALARRRPIPHVPAQQVSTKIGSH